MENRWRFPKIFAAGEATSCRARISPCRPRREGRKTHAEVAHAHCLFLILRQITGFSRMNRIVWLSNPVNPCNPAILSKNQKLSSFTFSREAQAAGCRAGEKRYASRPPGGLSPPRWWRHPKDHGGCAQKTMVGARKRPWWLRAIDHGGCAQSTLVA